MLRSAWVFLCLVLLIAAPENVSAQDPTAASVITAANEVLTKLQNVGTALTGNASIAVGGATTQVSDLISQFEQAIGANINAPLSSLGMDARILGTQLMETTAVLDVLVSRQRECIFQNLDLFLSGIHTVTADLANQVPLVGAQQPRLSKFQFDGRLTPNVVPESGGRLTMTGFRLWDDGIAPAIAIWDAGRQNKLVEPSAGRAGNDHTVSFVVNPAIIQQHPGECLQVNVKTYARRKFLGIIPYGRRMTGDLYMPMCIPEAYGMRVRMEARVDYTVGTPNRRVVSTKRFSFINTDMANSINVTDTKRWDDEIPVGWRIMEAPYNLVKKENDSNIRITFTDRSVTAAGYLSDAEDLRTGGFFGPRIKIDDTEWIADVTPIIAGTVVDHKTATAQYQVTDLRTPSTQMCVDLTVDGTPDPVSTYQIRVIHVPRGRGDAMTLYESQRLTTNMNTHTHQAEIGGYRVVTTYNPSIVQGNKTQACATVTSTGQCGF